MSKLAIFLTIASHLFFCCPSFARNLKVNGTVRFNSYYLDCNSDNYTLKDELFLNGRLKIAGKGSTFIYADVDTTLYFLFHKETNSTEKSCDVLLNEVYLSTNLTSDFIFSIGKKRVAWGVALSNNPLNFINPYKNPTDPEENWEGVYIAEGDYFWSTFSLNPLVVYNDDELGFGLKFSAFSILSGIDLNTNFYHSEKRKLNFGFSFDSTPFGDLPLLSDLALHGEIGLSQTSRMRREKKDFYKQVVTGFRYLLPYTETLLIAEYYYLEDGYTQKELAAYNPNETTIVIDPGNMGKHNLFVTIKQQNLTNNVNSFTDTLSISGILTQNMLDSSYFVAFRVDSAIIENILFSLEYTNFCGKEGTEYSFVPADYYVRFRMNIDF